MRRGTIFSPINISHGKNKKDTRFSGSLDLTYRLEQSDDYVALVGDFYWLRYRVRVYRPL